jgi:uncharacterized membrane protein YgdD (TMEM256/DUF423 family)
MKIFAFLGALNAALAVAAGAFAAHGLRERLDARHLEIFETGARYHMYHALGLLAVAWLAARGAPAATAAGWTMLAGIAIFSGSLYVLAITGISKLGAITPIGGLAFLVAWGLLAYGALRLPS